MSDLYTSLGQKPFLSHYLYVDAIIDHPVSKVWPFAVNLPCWMSAHHRWEPIDGEPGEVGLFWRLWPTTEYVGRETPPPNYHLAGIQRIIPYKFIGLEVFMEKGGSYGGMIPEDHVGFDNLLFADLGAKTQVTALFIEESKTALTGGSEEASVANVANHFENLKKFIDGKL
jgi:hypothetical protein